MATIYHMRDLGPVLNLSVFIYMEDEHRSTTHVLELTGHLMSCRMLTCAWRVWSTCCVSGTVANIFI